MSRVVVTGGAGFIGQHLVQAMNKKGNELHTLDLKPSECSVDLTSYVQTKQYFEEITDRMSKPIDIVYDLATMPLTQSLKEPYVVAYKIYCMATVLCELMREGYFKKMVHTSSSEVYGHNDIAVREYHQCNPNTPYAAAKAAQDMLMLSYNRTFGLPIAIARPFNNFGPGQTLNAVIPATIKRILLGKQPIVEGDGKDAREFIYVDDTVRGIITIGNNMKKTQGKVFNLKGDDFSYVTMHDLVLKIGRLMGSKKRIKFIKTRHPQRQIQLGNAALVENTLGFKAKLSLEEGLKRTIAWWKRKKLSSISLPTQHSAKD